MSITPDETASRPSQLEQVIRFLVWFSVIGCIATPVIVMALVYGKVFGAFWGAGNGPVQPIWQINIGTPSKPENRQRRARRGAQQADRAVEVIYRPAGAGFRCSRFASDYRGGIRGDKARHRRDAGDKTPKRRRRWLPALEP